jgi:hypothetical protein
MFRFLDRQRSVARPDFNRWLARIEAEQKATQRGPEEIPVAAAD